VGTLLGDGRLITPRELGYTLQRAPSERFIEVEQKNWGQKNWGQKNVGETLV
jgi:hypothetical protein